MNMPATLMWARGLDRRSVRVTFEPPKGLSWVAATQLFPTDDPWTFTAPNLQYLMDSPTELSAQTIRTFKVRGGDGRESTIRVAIHHDAGEAEVNEYVAGAEKIVREHGAVFGEYPEFEPGHYTFLGDYVPWGGGDGMEHRNSTVVAAPVSLRMPGMVGDVLDTVSHEFFHAWNVERIRPKTLEPFNFEEANISGELWLAEGFTQYYGTLDHGRARACRRATRPRPDSRAPPSSVINSPGRQFRSAVQMSQMAPFTDAARAVDKTNFSTTFISYYTYGAAVALALDLSLRDRSNGKISLDDYMQAMWRVHGKPGASAAGPGRQAVHAGGCARASRRSVRRSRVRRRVLRQVRRGSRRRRLRAPVAARRIRAHASAVRVRRGSGRLLDGNGTINNLTAWGSPAFEAGLDQGDVIVDVDGKAIAAGVLAGGDESPQAGRSPHRHVQAARRRDRYGDDRAEGRSLARGRDRRIDRRDADAGSEGVSGRVAGIEGQEDKHAAQLRRHRHVHHPAHRRRRPDAEEDVERDRVVAVVRPQRFRHGIERDVARPRRDPSPRAAPAFARRRA